MTISVVAPPAAGGPTWIESVADRVVPMHAVREPGDPAGREVDLEREAAAGRPGRAEQPATIGTLHDTHDPGRQVEQPGESRQIEVGRRCDRAGRPGPRSPIQGPAPSRAAAGRPATRADTPCTAPAGAPCPGDEIGHHAGVADRDGTAWLRPLQPRPVPRRGQAMIEARRISSGHRRRGPTLPKDLEQGSRARPRPRPTPDARATRRERARSQGS